MSYTDLPSVNAALNLVSAALLARGYWSIRRHRRDDHRRAMLGALAASVAFLASYLVYHGAVGSVPYARFDWTRPLYFAILIPHIVLAAGMAPFIALAVWQALRDHFESHRRIARWLWPVWIFVSVSGVVIYLMLYHLAPTQP